jgi:hypothetical protein
MTWVAGRDREKFEPPDLAQPAEYRPPDELDEKSNEYNIQAVREQMFGAGRTNDRDNHREGKSE